MISPKAVKTASYRTNDETAKKIEEAAYYCFLNRERYAHEGNDLTDWFEAEKEIRGNFQVGPAAP